MPKLLHMICSPRADSESAAGARVFLDRFRQSRSDWDFDDMNLWREPLPEFDGAILDAKYARIGGRGFSTAERDAFAVAERLAMRFALADRVVISTPMWNFSIPYKLKQWIDVITQPGLTFRFDPAQGYLPLLKDRPTLLIIASGSDFATGMNRGRVDMATPYLREALRFIGVRDVQVVLIGPTAGPNAAIEASRTLAHRRLEELGARF
ncbi:putative (Acyl-carrier-protein) phosphodiesterase (ACP phosphodiesterase) [Bradyrhizobium sp. STM 3843]|uniref:FMN-dependent NADH-azoreductase n=1 Tax=Bradyrhizobium sp. STM 3843 TaxID=551947 RepID=UPI0002403841|nr:NAD(P)H-dependent oxidoreductase [Bradyrhizobium sp. STM 3843]CCE10269.1 putative (Acyl-carrier-protein) phosphodiesterase (ACP phosphodiesterase) [Bradyrhizobium sp. STM 3843]